MVYFLRPVDVSPFLNSGYNVPKQILESRLSLRAHNMLFAGINKYTLREKIQLAGRCMKDIFSNKTDDSAINMVKYYINRLKNTDTNSDEKNQLINILYSTAIKKILVGDIVSGRVSPNVYKSLIDDSINNYRENPIEGKIDYRHIAGRMLNLKKMYNSLAQSLGVLPKRLNILQWNEDKQLDYLTIMEKILHNYDATSKSFNVSKGYKYEFNNGVNYNYDSHQNWYMQNIKDLMLLTSVKIKDLLKNPKANKDIIEDKLDIAYKYYEKVPYTAPEVSILTPLFFKLKEQERVLLNFFKKSKNNSKSCLT